MTCWLSNLPAQASGSNQGGGGAEEEREGGEDQEDQGGVLYKGQVQEESGDDGLDALMWALNGDGKLGLILQYQLMADGDPAAIEKQVTTLRIGELQIILARNQQKTSGKLQKRILVERVCELIKARRATISRAHERVGWLDKARQWFKQNKWMLEDWGDVIATAQSSNVGTLAEILGEHGVDTSGPQKVLARRVCEVILAKRAEIASADDKQGKETRYTELASTDPDTEDPWIADQEGKEKGAEGGASRAAGGSGGAMGEGGGKSGSAVHGPERDEEGVNATVRDDQGVDVTKGDGNKKAAKEKATENAAATRAVKLAPVLPAPSPSHFLTMRIGSLAQ